MVDQRWRHRPRPARARPRAFVRGVSGRRAQGRHRAGAGNRRRTGARPWWPARAVSQRFPRLGIPDPSAKNHRPQLNLATFTWLYGYLCSKPQKNKLCDRVCKSLWNCSCNAALGGLNAPQDGSIAQLDRASDYESEGRAFESLWVHHLPPFYQLVSVNAFPTFIRAELWSGGQFACARIKNATPRVTRSRKTAGSGGTVL